MVTCSHAYQYIISVGHVLTIDGARSTQVLRSEHSSTTHICYPCYPAIQILTQVQECCSPAHRSDQQCFLNTDFFISDRNIFPTMWSGMHQYVVHCMFIVFYYSFNCSRITFRRSHHMASIRNIWITEYLDHRISGSQNIWITEYLDHRMSGSQNIWITEYLDHRISGSQNTGLSIQISAWGGIGPPP